MRVGRNDLCPCGSGKKSKRCCGAARAGPAAPLFDLAAAYWDARAEVRQLPGSRSAGDLAAAAFVVSAFIDIQAAPIAEELKRKERPRRR